MGENTLDKTSVLNATHGGKDIFLSLFSGHSLYLENTRKMFRSPFRENDQVPSSHYIERDGIFYLKDFGDRSYNAIDAYAMVHNTNFGEALKSIAKEFNLGSDKKEWHPMALYNKRPACEGQADGTYIEEKDFTDAEIKLLCPIATREILHELGFVSVQRYYIVKDGMEHSYSSQPGYPIFARTCRMIDSDGNVTSTVHKIYQPRYRAKDGKNFKFMYQERDKHPDSSIINGLYEIMQSRQNGETFISAAIVSGERDAVSCRCMGIMPIWFNSEGHIINDAEMRLIRQFTNKLQYIPDIDEPGMAMAMKNIIRHPELLTVWLPEDLRKHHGDQRKPKKDLRDWIETHHTQRDFDALLNSAHRYKFARTVLEGKNKNTPKVKVSPDDMRYFLKMNGYFQYKDPVSGQVMLVNIVDKKVTEVTTQDIRNFIIKESDKYKKNERDAVATSNVTRHNITDVEEIALDFTTANKCSQLIYAQNATFVVTGEGISEVDGKQQGYVWERKVIKHDVTLVEPMLTFTPTDDHKAIGITINDDRCKALRFVRNISCLHWRALEIGTTLTEKEKQENEQNFCAFIYAIGYLLHAHRSHSRTIAPYLFEYERVEDIKRNGGTGKSTLVEQLLKVMALKIDRISMKSKKALEDRFLFQESGRDTDIVFFDECGEDFGIDSINDYVTSGIQIEQKNKNRYTLPFEDSPRIALASNFDPKDFDPSSKRRAFFLPVSHYYHHAGVGTSFKESRSIQDDFGVELWSSEYREEDFNLDINFLMQCLQYYLLHVGQNIPRPQEVIGDVVLRKNENACDDDMAEWAVGYFLHRDNCNKEIARDAMLADYNKWALDHTRNKLTATVFKKRLKVWVSCYPNLEFNPIDRCNAKDSQRIRHNNIEYFYIARTTADTSPSASATSDEEGNIDFSAGIENDTFSY